MKKLFYSFLVLVVFAFGVFSNNMYASITAYVTLSDYDCYSSQNSGHAGEIIIFHSTVPDAGNNYDGVAGRLTITGNVTNAPVVLSYTSGYFTCVFNDKVLAQQAIGVTSSPIDFSTSTSNLSNGATFNITLSCQVPDVTPPSPQSAATTSGGTQVTIIFDESVQFSSADVSDFTVKVNGSSVTTTGVSYIGSTAVISLQDPITVGNTVTVSYNNSAGGLMDDSGNPTSSFTNFSVTNTNPPTLTAFADVVATTNQNTEVEISLADLKAQGNEADTDGTVDAFIVNALSTGSLKIGATSGTATAFSSLTNKTIDASNNAYWTPATDATGTLNAFTVTVMDNDGAESAGAVQATVNVVLPRFVGPGNSFLDPANWDGGIVPANNLDIIIAAGQTLYVDEDYTCGTLKFEAGASFQCTGGKILTITGNVLDKNGDVAIEVNTSLIVSSSITIEN